MCSFVYAFVLSIFDLFLSFQASAYEYQLGWQVFCVFEVSSFFSERTKLRGVTYQNNAIFLISSSQSFYIMYLDRLSLCGQVLRTGYLKRR